MDEETPLLVRHPLQNSNKAACVTPQPLVFSATGGLDASVSDGSDTDLEVMSVCSDESVQGLGNIEEDEDIADTQQVDPRPLVGLIVFVEVRSGTDNCENRQAAIAHHLELLGATVAQRLTKDVTHMVFKDGRLAIKEKAEKKGIYLVSPLWLDACKRANDRVSEAKYPVVSKDGSDSPVVLGRMKRIKSMQPKPLVEEITKSLERSRKKRKTNTPCKATPVRSNTIRATKINSDDEDDDYKLPEVTLPDTPLRESPGLGTGLSKEKVSNGYTPGNGKKLSSKDGYTGNRSTDRQTVSDQVVDKQSASLKITPIITGKKLSRKKATTTDELGKGSEKKKAKSETQAPKRTLVAGDSGRKRPHPLDRENEVTSTKGVTTATKGPLQPISTNSKRNKQEDDKEGIPKPKKKKIRIQGRTFEKHLPTIVMTSVHTSEQETVLSIVEKLGHFRCVKSVCESTSHVVCGSPRRTINILSATLRGCWIVSLDWVMKSLECGSWVSEEPFEMVSSFPAAKFYRLQRQSSFITYQPELFKRCGSVFLASGTAPPSQQLEALLILGGGKVTTSHRKADVCVGCKSWSNTVKNVSEQWILDSISAHSLQPVDNYLLDAPQTREVSPEL